MTDLTSYLTLHEKCRNKNMMFTRWCHRCRGLAIETYYPNMQSASFTQDILTVMHLQTLCEAEKEISKLELASKSEQSRGHKLVNCLAITKLTNASAGAAAMYLS